MIWTFFGCSNCGTGLRDFTCSHFSAIYNPPPVRQRCGATSVLRLRRVLLAFPFWSRRFRLAPSLAVHRCGSGFLGTPSLTHVLFRAIGFPLTSHICAYTAHQKGPVLWYGQNVGNRTTDLGLPVQSGTLQHCLKIRIVNPEVVIVVPSWKRPMPSILMETQNKGHEYNHREENNFKNFRNRLHIGGAPPSRGATKSPS